MKNEKRNGHHKASSKHADKPAFTTCLPNGSTGTITFTEVDILSDYLASYMRFELKLSKELVTTKRF